MKYLRLEEVRQQYGVSESDIEMLAREQLIEVKHTLEDERVMSAEDAENARLVLMLLNELDVNLPGAEVIVHMRAEMLAMARQFGRILETLVDELRQTISNVPRD